MKTEREIKFDELITNAFHLLLKPLGFKKRRYNFYLQREDLGQIINIQKSFWYSKSHIHFTINTGIFIPQYWKALLNFHGKEVPDFPTEPECVIRKRIGELKQKGDVWYDLTEKTDLRKLTSEIRKDVEDFILPHFEKTKTIESILYILEREKFILEPLGKLILFSEFKKNEQAKKEYKSLLSEKSNPYFLETVKRIGKKYEIE